MKYTNIFEVPIEIVLKYIYSPSIYGAQTRLGSLGRIRLEKDYMNSTMPKRKDNSPSL